MVKAIIIKGNPKYINNDLARNYYKEIEKFLKSNGVDRVEFNDGKAYTIPKLDADIYIGHSRGCDRYEHMPKDKQKVFLKFGVPDGFIDPVDLKWQKEVWVKDTDEQPPKEHFILIDSQKKAILDLLAKLKNTSLENYNETIPLEILQQADKDPFLEDIIEVDKDKTRVPIYFGKVIAGFYTPRQTEYKKRMYWRTGAIYILPKYRKKGLASKAISEFFSDKEYGLAFIEPHNAASLATFEKCGFKRTEIIIGKRTSDKFWRMLKEPELRPAFLSW